MVSVTLFWISVILILIFGTLGGVLFKFGTNELGSIGFSRLTEFRVTAPSLAYGAMLVVGLLLFVVGGSALRPWSFAANYLFTPVIFAGLVMLAVSRFLMGIPLSVTGLGRLSAIILALSAVATAVASAIVFKESFSIRTIAGIALAAIAVFLIGEEI